MKLNIFKLKNELGRINKKMPWLAGRVGVTRQAAYWWVRNPERVPMTTIGKIARALGVDPKDLIK